MAWPHVSYDVISRNGSNRLSPKFSIGSMLEPFWKIQKKPKEAGWGGGDDIQPSPFTDEG